MTNKNFFEKVATEFKKKEILSLLSALFITTLAMENVGLHFWLISLIFLFLKLIIPSKFRYFLGSFLAVAAVLYVLKIKGTLLNIEAGLSLLTLLQACKYLAAKTKDDYLVHSNVLLFIVTGQVLFNQNILSILTAFSS